MGRVLRWGRSAYERDEDLALERDGARALGFAWTLDEDRTRPPPELADVEVLVVNSRVRVDETVASRLAGRLIVTTTSGYDHLDLRACGSHGVTVARCPKARRDAVVEHALVGLGAMLRRIPMLDEAARAGRWARGDLPALAPRTLRGSRVVVVGLGVIGSRVAEVLDVLGAEVLAVDPFVDVPRPRHDLDDVLPSADAVTLHCALTPETRGLLGTGRLDVLPAHAVVVNTARGEALDVEAAKERVEAGRLGGLVCDVFPVEPYPALAARVVPGVWLTPHAAGYASGLGLRLAHEVVAALRAWVAGSSVPDVIPWSGP